MGTCDTDLEKNCKHSIPLYTPEVNNWINEKK